MRTTMFDEDVGFTCLNCGHCFVSDRETCFLCGSTDIMPVGDGPENDDYGDNGYDT